MGGRTIKLIGSFLVMLLFVECTNNTKPVNNSNLIIRLTNSFVKYNNDTIHYYIVNNGDEDINILYNPEFFYRNKDSLVVDSWFNPEIEIMDDENNIVSPDIYSVDYVQSLHDSIRNIRNLRKDYVEIHESNIEKLYDKVIKRHKLVLKKHDSIKFSTKVNFESEVRFYDLYGQEGFILNKNRRYNLQICLNEHINPKFKNKLAEGNIYSRKICSNKINLVFIKSNYSE